MLSSFKKIALTVVFTVIGIISVNAQTDSSKLITLINKAQWCHVCRDNGPRIQKEIVPIFMKDPNVQVVVNDLSNDDTKAKSEPILKKLGLLPFVKTHLYTGVIFFINGKTKELISTISISKSNKKILKAYDKALAKYLNKNDEKCSSCHKCCSL